MNLAYVLTVLIAAFDLFSLFHLERGTLRAGICAHRENGWDND